MGYLFEIGWPFKNSLVKARLTLLQNLNLAHVNTFQAHWNQDLPSPYHHLHTLPEASAACWGTEGLTRMLSLCYGWNQDTITRNTFEKEKKKDTKLTAKLLCQEQTQTRRETKVGIWKGVGRALGRLFTYRRYNRSIMECLTHDASLVCEKWVPKDTPCPHV